MEDKIKQFREDYMKYTEACILYAETQASYEPLDWDRDVEWIQDWMRENLCTD